MMQLNLCLFGIALGFSLFQSESDIDPRRQRVVAQIGKQDVTIADVDLLLGRDAASSDLPKQTLNLSLAILAKQRSALETMRRLKIAVQPDAIDRWIESQASQLPERPSNDQWIEQRAMEAGVTESSLRESIAFRLSWKTYLAKHLNEQTLLRHFENQPHRFDGTTFSIERVSIAVPVGQSTSRDSAKKRLSSLLAHLHRGENASDEIELHAPDLTLHRESLTGSSEVDPIIMDFVAKAKLNRWSPPIDSIVGVHLVRVVGTEPGDREFEAVKDEVRANVIVYLLDYLARTSADRLPLKLVSDSAE
ncbi:MAG: hypothetical protein Aurels2KO_36900 [Aureliella sp.]